VLPHTEIGTTALPDSKIRQVLSFAAYPLISGAI